MSFVVFTLCSPAQNFSRSCQSKKVTSTQVLHVFQRVHSVDNVFCNRPVVIDLAIHCNFLLVMVACDDDI